MTTRVPGNNSKATEQAPPPANRPPETGTISLEEAEELAHIGSWQWDAASGDITWSDELYRIYGLRPGKKALDYGSFMQLIHPEDRDKINKLIDEAYRSKRPFGFEHRIILPDKKIRTLGGQCKVVTDDAGNVIRVLGTSQDITERKKSDQALYRSNERFQAVLAATNDLVYDLDLPSGTIWFNDVLSREYKYPKQEAPHPRGWRVSHIHSDDKMRIKRSLDALLRSDDMTWVEEYTFLKYDGTPVDIRDRAFVLRDIEARPIRVIGSMLDITRQKELERAKDRFISLVSHQLRTPLTSMRLLAEMLAAGQAEPITPSQQEYVQKIESSTKRMIELVNEILNVSNIESGQLHLRLVQTDINSLIQGQIDEVTPLTAENNIRIVYEQLANIPPVDVDPILFRQIVHNLLTNAIRYTAAEQTIVQVKFQRTDKEYMLTVSDKGIGIPEEAWPHIFTSFYRANNAVKTHGDGTGLGLYLAKLILDLTGGKIWFESEEGKGSTFYVSLPHGGMRHAQDNTLAAVGGT